MPTDDNKSAWFRRRETPSFEAVYAEHGTRIYRFCHRLCGNAIDAEDLAQEVFVAAFQGLSNFKGRSTLATWLYRIALYRWHAGRARRRPEIVPLELVSEPSSVDPSAAGLDRISLDAAIASLPENWREAFILVKVEGLTCREAAKALEIPEGTLKFYVHRAIEHLRAELRTEEMGEGTGSRSMRGSATSRMGAKR